MSGVGFPLMDDSGSVGGGGVHPARGGIFVSAEGVGSHAGIIVVQDGIAASASSCAASAVGDDADTCTSLSYAAGIGIWVNFIASV